MMKQLNSILVLLLFPFFAFCQTKQYKINHQLFTFVLDSTQNNHDAPVLVTLYRGDKQILKHTIFYEEGDCSSINLELGSYKVSNNKLIFYSYWAVTDRQAYALLPFGFRKQVYKVDSSGKVTLEESIIYKEDYVARKEGKEAFFINEWKHKGVYLLDQAPSNSEEQALLHDYITTIEQNYHSKFVLNKEKSALEAEVRQEMSSEIEQHTGAWEEGEIYGAVKK